MAWLSLIRLWFIKAFFAFLVIAFVALGIASCIIPLTHPLSQPHSYRESVEENGKTYFWNLGYIAESKKKSSSLLASKQNPALSHIIAEAEDAMKWGPYSVVDKTSLLPGMSKHDFCDLSPYFWPNPILPGGKPYYFKDGLVNPEANSDAFDRVRYLYLLRALQRLSLGYYFTSNEKYAERASLLIRTWFLNPDTRMNPHFRHSQVIPGLTDGFSLGVIRATELVQILDTLALIAPSPSWTKEDHQKIAEWFRDYLKWTTTSSFGEREYQMRNNHGTWYDASTSAIALFTGNPAIARDILSRSATKRINVQIAPDGNQPIETRRARSLYYAIYNLHGLFTLAELSERVGIDLWNYKGPQGQSLKKAIDYLLPYAIGEKPWTGQKVIPDEGWGADLVPLLRIAADKYHDPAYLTAISKLPLQTVQQRLWILWNCEPPQKLLKSEAP